MNDFINASKKGIERVYPNKLMLGNSNISIKSPTMFDIMPLIKSISVSLCKAEELKEFHILGSIKPSKISIKKILIVC